MLKVRVLEVEEPELLCVLCHGYGAPGDDLVGLVPEVLRAQPALSGRVAFAFPEAPLEIPGVPFGRAWWPIDVTHFERALVSGKLEELFEEVPEGMAEARGLLRESVTALARDVVGLPMSKVVLGGFSQGAMLATDLALRLDDAPAALAVLSGTLLCRGDWKALAPRRKGLPVLQSHGTADPLLPFAAAKELERLLRDAGLDVTFVSFAGGHGIDHGVLDALAALVAARLP